jgi:hypothetical protein
MIKRFVIGKRYGQLRYSTISSKTKHISIGETRGRLLLPQLEHKIQDQQYKTILLVLFLIDL